MKHILMFTLAFAAIATTALGSPCWSQGGSCGSTNSCSWQGPPAGASSTPCFHQYCDDGQVCAFDSGKKRIMMSDRTLYFWMVGQSLATCVTGAVITDTQTCCQCAQPGVVYTLPMPPAND